MSDFRSIRKGLLGSKFMRRHRGCSIHARREKGPGKQWDKVCVLLGDTRYDARKRFKSLRAVERWGVTTIRDLLKDEDRVYILWDDREHLFLVESPYWDAGVWTGTLEKAGLFTKQGIDEHFSLYKSKLQALTLREAREMLSKATYIRRVII